MESKYPKQKVIAVDVDDTLIIDDMPNEPLIEWLRDKADDHFLILWSMQGQEHAVKEARMTGTTELFDVIISKPGYIVDDDGWNWTMHTEVIGPDIETKPRKKKRKGSFTDGQSLRASRMRSRSKL